MYSFGSGRSFKLLLYNRGAFIAVIRAGGEKTSSRKDICLVLYLLSSPDLIWQDPQWTIRSVHLLRETVNNKLLDAFRADSAQIQQLGI